MITTEAKRITREFNAHAHMGGRLHIWAVRKNYERSRLGAKMKSHIYEIICTDAAGWNNESLWGPQYEYPETRLFATLVEATQAKSTLDAFDYGATLDFNDLDEDEAQALSAENHQPTFAIVKISTVDTLEHAAMSWQADQDVFERLIDIASVQLPDDDEPGDLFDRPSEEIKKWLDGLNRTDWERVDALSIYNQE